MFVKPITRQEKVKVLKKFLASVTKSKNVRLTNRKTRKHRFENKKTCSENKNRKQKNRNKTQSHENNQLNFKEEKQWI